MKMYNNTSKNFGTIKMICIVKKILPDLYLPATDLLILYN